MKCCQAIQNFMIIGTEKVILSIEVSLKLYSQR